ncbi:hypothetical protein FQP90_09160 [Paenarthrobacter nitroguajacolicus]|uniref:Uncharacterized protein n=1 Tax=Paenarthrobacter nitroguajacolicus TaxID=211146 RepID=A0A558H4W8_PAENT|nr:hypothetical protein [Paenarthrobacter nitroguajacolicus]TVU64141.1 hypothetical protein FQP90_09160 [Paenarthrobacter nitroguajacolicus]
MDESWRGWLLDVVVVPCTADGSLVAGEQGGFLRDVSGQDEMRGRRILPARQSVDHLPTWLASAERLGNEREVDTTLLKGASLAQAEIPRGPLWRFVIEQSRDALDYGLFADEAGAATWLHSNRDVVVVAEATRRLDAFQAAVEMKHGRRSAP